MAPQAWQCRQTDDRGFVALLSPLGEYSNLFNVGVLKKKKTEKMKKGEQERKERGGERQRGVGGISLSLSLSLSISPSLQLLGAMLWKGQKKKMIPAGFRGHGISPAQHLRAPSTSRGQQPKGYG